MGDPHDDLIAAATGVVIHYSRYAESAEIVPRAEALLVLDEAVKELAREIDRRPKERTKSDYEGAMADLGDLVRECREAVTGGSVEGLATYLYLNYPTEEQKP